MSRATIFWHVPPNVISCWYRMLQWIDNFVGHIMAFSHDWNYFIISFDDFRKGSIRFVSTSINFFSGAESPVFSCNLQIFLISFERSVIYFVRSLILLLHFRNSEKAQTESVLQARTIAVRDITKARFIEFKNSGSLKQPSYSCVQRDFLRINY
jgi:hypothetical protein